MAVEDAIVVGVSEGEDNGERLLRRTRKPTEKAKQNEESQILPNSTPLATKKRVGSVTRGAATNNAGTNQNGCGGEDEQATLETLQGHINEQTKILKALLESNKELQAEVGQVKEELRAVKEEC